MCNKIIIWRDWRYNLFWRINTQGGKLIVGVDDTTHQVIGVENDVLFSMMDAIANAVSDACTPQIIPDIEPQTVEGKTVIVVSVEAGKNRPYYLKSKGKENGTYVRVAGTSRRAFPEKIKELEMEGARISWDELTCVGYPVTEAATIEGLVRKEKYELPPEAIREMIINAHCHRNLLEESCIQVAIYDDRLEVTSPGGLYNGLTYEEVMNGHSKIRNKGIANIFSQMGLIEAWGSGIKRIFTAAKEYGFPKPKFQEFDNMFRVELFRNSFSVIREGQDIGEASEDRGCQPKCRN